MLRFSLLTKALVTVLFFANFAWAQESMPEKLQDQVSEIGDKVGEIGDKVGEIGKTLDEVPAVQDVSAGILQPIYELAESQYINFPAFHWVAFCLMVAGVVSFAGQLVLSKLFLLLRFKLSIKEVLSDALGLLISAVGLILTTQAATENSTFTQTPSAVISSAVVGALAGFVFYLWGQRTEFDAARTPAKE